MTCSYRNLKHLVLLFLVTLSISCSKEKFYGDNDVLIQASNPDIRINNGRLHFDSEESFKMFYKNLKDKDEREIVYFIENKLYNNDFYSLKPLGRLIENENILKDHVAIYKETNRSLGVKSMEIEDEDILEHFDDIEDVFGEELFESVLNHNAEIQIGTKVYKYTDKGLFYTPLENIEVMYDFIERNQVHSLNDISNIEKSRSYPEFNLSGGEKEVATNVVHYIQPIELKPYPGDGGGGGGGNPGPINPPTDELTEPEFNEIVNQLEICNGKEPWLGNLFGTTVVCIDEYRDNDKRVKIKYYNIDAKLVQAIGVKVKHQKKGWTGLWRKQDTERMALGVNSVTWKFSHNNTIPTNAPVNFYTYNNKFYQSSGSFADAVYAGQDIPIPPLPFGDKVDVIVEIAISGFTPFESEYEVREWFYDNVFNAAKSVVNSSDPSINKEFNSAGVIINTNFNTYVQYYDFSSKCNDCDKIEKSLDLHIMSPKINYTFGPGGFDFDNFDFSLEMDFSKPSVTGFNIYGMAKAGGEWHGKNLIYGQNP